MNTNRFSLPLLTLLTLLIVGSLVVSGCQGDRDTALETRDDAVTDTMVGMPSYDSPSLTKINLNTASESDFRSIPGVNEDMVGEFLEYRPYSSIGEFREEIGKYVSPDQVAAYEEHVFVPIQPNESDAETLQQLPGVDMAEAESLVAARPYASHDAFLEKVAEFVSDEEANAAATYLAH